MEKIKLRNVSIINKTLSASSSQLECAFAFWMPAVIICFTVSSGLTNDNEYFIANSMWEIGWFFLKTWQANIIWVTFESANIQFAGICSRICLGCVPCRCYKERIRFYWEWKNCISQKITFSHYWKDLLFWIIIF